MKKSQFLIDNDLYIFMLADIFSTYSTRFFHTIGTYVKITCITMENFTIIYNTIMQKTPCFSSYIFFLDILKSMLMDRFIIVLIGNMSLNIWSSSKFFGAPCTFHGRKCYDNKFNKGFEFVPKSNPSPLTPFSSVSNTP